MDKGSPALLTITKFSGLNTNAPHGTHDQPTRLENAYLDRTGGYAPQYARSSQLAGVSAALPALYANDLFVMVGGAINYFDAFLGTASPVPVFSGGALGNLNQAVPLMPGLLLGNSGGAYILKDASMGLADTGLVASDFSFEYAPPNTGVAGFDGALEYDVLVVALPRKDAFSTTAQQGAATLLVGAGHSDRVGTAPPTTFLFRVRYKDTTASFAVYYRQHGTQQAWVFGGYSDQYPNLGYALSPLVGPDFDRTEDRPQYLTFNAAMNAASAYHQGRVYLAPSVGSTYFDPASSTGLTTKAIPNRVYYSAVIAAATSSSYPRFSAAMYFDAPFRVSRRVVALLSVGSYLYIFGDRELLLLTGDPSADSTTGRIESIGDSIGTVAATSVQQLGGVGYWLSDSGVMAVRGGQVQEVGADVRDLLAGMNAANVTSTVDFKRELYILTDGVITLVYHARENAWATRQQSESGRLIYGGGTAYAVDASVLYSLGGEPGIGGALPARLLLAVEWGPLECGTWSGRKRFDTLAIGVDLQGAGATLTQQSDVMERGLLVTGDAQTVSLPAGPGYNVSHVSKDQTKMTGQSIRPRYVLSSQDPRGILRPPLVLTGAVTSEIGVD